MIAPAVTPVFSIRDLSKTRERAGHRFELSIPNLVLAPGDAVVARGRSGSGKSTMLDLLAMTLQPTQCGQFHFAYRGGPIIDVYKLWRQKRQGLASRIRGESVGYVLQTGDLLPFLSVRENIALPIRMFGGDDSEVNKLATRLGIDHLLGKKPSQISVGERQRAAIGRALVHHPAVILADEPTASVDPVSADEVFSLLLSIARDFGVALIVASHDWERLDALGLPALEHSVRENDGVIQSQFWN